MTKSFFIEFKNNFDEFTLKFDILNTDIGNKWFIALKESLDYCENPIRENDRFYNFPSHNWTEEKIINVLNDCIIKINNYKRFIDIKATVNADEEHYNKLHKYFELMRGHIDNPNSYFANAPYNIKTIINLYNNTIHRLENYIRTKNVIQPRIVVTFKYDPRYPLVDNDFDQFTVLSNFGTIYLDYCEVGKPILDVFHDNDNIVGDKSIIPQRFYSAGLCLKFYGGPKTNILDGYDNWWNTNEKYLNDLGFYKNDKTLSIGFCPVATIDFNYINNISKNEIIDTVGKFTTVNRIYIG